jgi:hypothetical protein
MEAAEAMFHILSYSPGFSKASSALFPGAFPKDDQAICIDIQSPAHYRENMSGTDTAG